MRASTSSRSRAVEIDHQQVELCLERSGLGDHRLVVGQPSFEPDGDAADLLPGRLDLLEGHVGRGREHRNGQEERRL